MPNNVFIIGSSLISGLGNTPRATIEQLQSWDLDYLPHVAKAQADNRLYRIQGFTDSPTQRYYQILEQVVKTAVQSAGLTSKQQSELTIFIGSTSMKISTDEEKLTHLGNRVIGEFVEEITGSTQGFYIFSTACTSSTNALSYAAKMLQHGKIKRALVIGIELFNHSTTTGFESLMLLSKSGIYRPFDERSDGVILGEACSAVILDGHAQTTADCELLGSANVCENESETTSNPDGKAIYRCLQGAIDDAGLTLDDIDLIKAHGTGSENNNAAEATAITRLLGQKSKPVCALKPFVGHTLGASGINEMVLLMWCLSAGFIPRVGGFEKNTDITFQPLQNTLPVNQTQTVLLNSIGFSGNNTAVLLRIPYVTHVND